MTKHDKLMKALNEIKLICSKHECNDEELAKFLDDHFNVVSNEICKSDCSFEYNCKECILKWLHKEVEDNDA